ncbi:hypothetical protein ABID22_003349 [Pontibacter aydingkolensis]
MLPFLHIFYTYGNVKFKNILFVATIFGLLNLYYSVVVAIFVKNQ